MWQGGPIFLMGVIGTATTHFAFGYIWVWTVLVAAAGLFWLIAGLITYFTGIE